jgi:hypothetical protein
MRNWFVSLALAAVAGLPATSQAGPAIGGTYVGGGLLLQDVDGFDDGMALSLRGAKAIPGILADNVRGTVSVEGELTQTLVSPEADLPATAANDSVELDITTLGGYGVYTLPVDRVRFRGRMGVVYEHISAEGGDDDSELNLSLGFGAGVMVTRRVEVGADYTYIEEDINHLGVNALFHF